jgi:flagellar biosynthesis protein
MNDRTTPRKVIGLAFEARDELPRVVVKGCGEAAERILHERDWLHGPGVVKDPQLLEQLYRLPMDGTIGPELFQLVAILLTHVFAIEERLRGESQ